MVAWKVYIVQQHHTKTAIFPTGLLLTTVGTGCVKTLTWLRAFENVVHTLRMTSCKIFMAAVDQTPIARELTRSLWAKLLEVEWLRGLHYSIHMSRATETQGLPN